MNYTLTNIALKHAKSEGGKPRKLSDGGGLHLFVSPTGAKSWRYKYRIGGKEHLFSIGLYPQVGLADARERHSKARELVARGLHPLAQQKADKHTAMLDAQDTFEALTRAWIAGKEAGWSPYYCGQIKAAMEKDVYPAIGGLPIKDVKAAHLLEVLKKVQARGAPVVAGNIKQWCSAVFTYAVANLKAENDPTAILRGAVVRPKVKHNVALNPAEIKALLAQIGKYGPFRTTSIAIELLMLMFVRTVELRKAIWKEFDLQGGEWHIPAERMKMKVPHVVPLSKQAVALLTELQTITGSRPHLFPNYRRPDAFMTPTTINQALKRVGFSGAGTIGFSAHGFRGTAATILYEKGYRSEVIEKQLSHAERNQVKAAYNQAQYLAERKTMMQDWADYVDTLRPHPT